FTELGCSACHGDDGVGTALAPSLVGITTKLPKDRLAALLHNPSAKMKAGGMPNVDAPPAEMDALIAYLGSLGPVNITRTMATGAGFFRVLGARSDAYRVSVNDERQRNRENRLRPLGLR
ncbi:MAG TPA: cytochrome c, partial [Terracidiphilus sp.]